MTHATTADTAASRGQARRGGWRLAARCLAAVLALIGLVLAAGGIWLIALDGSWYYAPAGLGLVLVAVLLWRQEMAALQLYLLVWLATVAWAFWEVGTDWWAQVPRLVAPTVILLAMLVMLPALGRRRAPARGTAQ
ncbi:glucose dehydrogenase [Oceanicella sp. SM1341]|uniref:glucose dehydrogenase n=1 Tax=Oceanicella sp. SM1341 TaxID=1548889 RepID=UPI000E4B1C72|nr:glucose dehydrogenase [Oceanicella sp. SM1341]